MVLCCIMFYPWDTPEIAAKGSGDWPFILAVHSQFCKKEVIHLNVPPFRPNLANLYIKISWFTESNALEKSKYSISTCFKLFKDSAV